MIIFQGAAAQDYYNDNTQYMDSSSSGYRDDNNKYNNNYYPPKDSDNNNNKKYVCEDGPFEGLFTSSVEFCKPDITVPTDFPTIQAAINASNPGDTIKVLPGTYTEQITISKSLTIIGSGAKSTIIEAPPLEELELNVLGLPYIVQINNEAQVSMKGFTIKGPEGTDCDTLLGISVLGDATLKLDSAVIKDCTFRSVFVGSLLTPSRPQAGHATITKTIITDYQNSGVFAVGPNSTLTMSYNKIVGSNPNAFATIGIFFPFAKGIITNNEVSGNICHLPECGPDFVTQLQAIGIATVDAGKGSVISNNYVSNNDAGIAVVGASGCCIIDYNKLLTDNRFFGIVIQDGEHTISNTKIFGGNVGVAAVAFTANTVAILDNVKIIGATTPVLEIPSGGFTAEVVFLSN